MKLTDLDPKLTDTTLGFRCPACGEHRIMIPIAPGSPVSGNPWKATGTVENLSVTPSIDAETRPNCRWHGFITNGEMLTC